MIDIRFNTNFPIGKSKFEWRIIKDDVEYLVNHVYISCPTFTSTRFIEGEGQKYHITANTDKLNIVTSTEEETEVKIAYIE